MAAPLLLMSTTSSSNSSQEMPMNPPPLAVLPPHPTTTRRHHHHDGRRSTPAVGGRPGKRASSKVPAPKKPPQRGPGVAQLEFLRHQEQLKKMTEMPHHFRGDWTSPHTELLGVVPPLPLGGTPVQYCMAPPTPVVFPGQMVSVGRVIDAQRSSGFPYGSDRVARGFYMPGVGGSAAVALEPPSELSSMPNLRCFPEHCDICMKQKNDMTSTRNIVVFDHGAADHTINNRQRLVANGVPDFLELNLGNGFSSRGNFSSREGSYGLHGSRQLTYQDVQAMNSVGGDHNRRLMEYEFFPGKSNSGSNTFPKNLCFPSMEHQAASSASAFAVVKNRSAAVNGAEASCSNPNPIDLSLRLSY